MSHVVGMNMNHQSKAAMEVIKRKVGQHSTHVFTFRGKAVTPTHELQRLGAWRTLSMVERYAHVASEDLQVAASRLDNALRGYAMATLEEKGNGP